MLKINMISESEFTVRGHGVHTAFIEMVAGLRARGDVVVRINSWGSADITHLQTVGPYALAHLLFGHGKKVISVHVIPDSFVGSLAGAKHWAPFARFYLKSFYTSADRLLAVSNEVAQTLSEGMGIPAAKISVLPNTVDCANYHVDAEGKTLARSALGLSRDAKIVLGVGQIQPRKRFDIMLNLAKTMPETTFIWVGGIPFKRLGASVTKMEALINDAPDNLIITGILELEQVKPYYQAADAFFLPSDQENHPLAILEAAAAGLPIVVRDIPEYDSSFGQDVVRGTDKTFGARLEQVLVAGPARNKAIAGSAHIAGQFDNIAGAERLIEAYDLTLL